MKCDSNKLHFNLGDRRRVTCSVSIGGVNSFELSASTWDLRKLGVKESSGVCEAIQDGKEWRLVAEVEPKQRGTYKLQFHYAIGQEKLNPVSEIIVS